MAGGGSGGWAGLDFTNGSAENGIWGKGSNGFGE